jgi:hypothetical protein
VVYVKIRELKFAVQTLSSINNIGKREEMPLATDPLSLVKCSKRENPNTLISPPANHVHLHAPAPIFKASEECSTDRPLSGGSSALMSDHYADVTLAGAEFPCTGMQVNVPGGSSSLDRQCVHIHIHHACKSTRAQALQHMLARVGIGLHNSADEPAWSSGGA